MTAGNIREVEALFARADPAFGPVALWWWSGEPVRSERLRWQIGRLADAGIRNLCVINLAPVAPTTECPPDEPSFASEAWWDLFEVALDEAEALGARLWFYDQLGFSSANLQARLVAAEPEMAGWKLTRLPVGEGLPPRGMVVAEISGWQYVAVREGFDYLDPQATAALFDRVHGELERRHADRLGRSIAGTFQDELPPMPEWHPELPARYRARFGEDLLAGLPALFEPAPAAGAVRRHVFSILGEMAEEAFFTPLRRWHDHHQMLIGCDQAGPGRAADPYGAQRLYLDYFRTHRHFSAPGSDMDGEAKPHSSMVHLYGGSRVWLEAFHSSGWGGTIEETLHWLVPWLQSGITLFNPHAVYYSTRGGWWEWAPPDTGWRQPYARHYSIFADTVARVSSLLSAGRHVCPIAVYYPASAVWEHCRFRSAEGEDHPDAMALRDPDDQVAHLRRVFWALTGRQGRHVAEPGVLGADRRDFDLVDETSLARAHVEDGRLVIGDERYEAVLLPAAGPRDEAARTALATLAASGGLVAAVAPLEEETLPAGTQILADTAEVPGALAHLVRSADGPGLALHRQVGDADVFLLLPPPGTLLAMYDRSTSESDAPAPGGRPEVVHASLRSAPRLGEPATYVLSTVGVPELWDPVSGRRSPLLYEQVEQGVKVDVAFDDWPAALVVARARPLPEERDAGEDRPSARPATVPPSAARQGGVAPGAELPAEGWQVRAVPLLDNRFGDFDLRVADPFLWPQCRRVRVRHELSATDGVAAGWHAPGFDDGTWPLRLWSEQAAWTLGQDPAGHPDSRTPVVVSDVFGSMDIWSWSGRMGRVPREYIDLGQREGRVTATTHVVVPSTGTYWLVLEGDGEKAAVLDGQEVQGLRDDGGRLSVAPVHLEEGLHPLRVDVTSAGEGALRLGVAVLPSRPDTQPVWLGPPGQGDILRSQVELPFAPSRARATFAVTGRGELWVNGRQAAVLGAFNPYSNFGEDVVDLTSHLAPGTNELEVVFLPPIGATAVLIDGIAESADGRRVVFSTDRNWREARGATAPVAPGRLRTESHWVRPRPHLLSDVGWLTPAEVPSPPPLAFVGHPSLLGSPVWLRFTLPVGAERMRLSSAARSRRLWVDGVEVPVVGEAASIPPGARVAALRIEPSGPETEAAVLRAPIVVEVGRAEGRLGDWRSALGLESFSGAVDYERALSGDAGVIDLGYVRGTAEVWLDGVSAGVRCWHPYRFELPEVRPGPTHRLRVRITNTLGAHYASGRPTVFVSDAQAASGLFGSVRTWPRA